MIFHSRVNRQGKYKEAMELHTKGLKIKLVTIGPDHPDVVHPKPKPETLEPHPGERECSLLTTNRIIDNQLVRIRAINEVTKRSGLVPSDL